MDAIDRAFIQRLLSNGSLEESKARKILQKLAQEEQEERPVVEIDLDTRINKMNPILRPYGLTVRRTVYDDGAMYIAIVNTSQDTLTSFASQYKPWEIVFFRKAIQEIVLESDEGEVEPSVLVNLREQGTSSDDVKELLRRLEKDQWLAPSRLDPANITLGTRAYLELIGFLSDLGIKKCTICKFEMLQGATCKNYSTSTDEQDQDQEDTCETIVHVTCLTKYQEKGLRFKCPTCKIPLIKK